MNVMVSFNIAKVNRFYFYLTSIDYTEYYYQHFSIYENIYLDIIRNFKFILSRIETTILLLENSAWCMVLKCVSEMASC